MRTKDITDHLEKIMSLEAISETGSIRQASEVLGVSQPSLSVKLKNIEEILGFQIFQRSQSGIQLTPRGQMVLDFVKRTQKNSDELRMQLESPQGVLSGHVRIGVYDSIARYFWPKFYKALNKKYPAISISLVTGRSHEIMDKLQRQELEIALTVEPGADQGLFQKVLYSDHFSCFGNEAVSSKSVNFKAKRGHFELCPDSRQYDIILFKQAMGQHMEAITSPKFKAHLVENFEIALEFCLQGIGLAVLPHRVAEKSLKRNKLKKVLISDELGLDFNPHNIVLSTNKQMQSQPATAAIFEEFYKIPEII